MLSILHEGTMDVPPGVTQEKGHTEFLIHLPYAVRAFIFYRALSLRNLFSGYKCGRVFPAGVGPDSPSRGAASWLASRFSL